MKKILLILVFLLFNFFAAFSQANEQKLDILVDEWHLAAARADFQAYFGLMDSSFVFLGTAPGERWNKQEFASFSKPYFEQGRAWDFKPADRNWNFSPDGKTAWFDEDLSTWMEDCRGSGVFCFFQDGWHLMYYNLTVLIENEKIKEFIELRNK